MHPSRTKTVTVWLLAAAILGQGCAAPNARLQYLIGDEKSLSHYEDMATAIEYPVEKESREVDPALFTPPRTINDLDEVKHRPMTLQECVRMALSKSTILRDDSSFGSPGNVLLANPGRAASVYDSAIQETSFLFGNRGPEAALSDFDTLLTQNVQVGRTEDPQNAPFLNLTAGDTLTDETAQLSTRLEKPLASSGTFSVQHDWNYSSNNVPSRLFPSAYTGFLQGEYRQPLLAGFGTEFTRVAGPLSQNLRGVSGVSQGVLISRINSDISLIDFEQSVSTTVRDVENRYWDLYLALKVFDSETETFRDLVRFRDRLAGRLSEPTAVYPALARMYDADARVKASLADVLDSEARLRRLMGMPLSDGELITPADHPSEAQMTVNWESALIEALANRPELRRQKWQIRSLELQLQASKNLARPRLDLVTQYRVNGFGDDLFGADDDDGQTDTGYNSAYESLTQGDNTTWNAGVSFSLPVGLRLARTQVRNYELQLVKSRATLSAQEQDIAYELNATLLNMQRYYAIANSNTKRLEAATAAMESSDSRLETDIKVSDSVTVLSRNLEAKTNLRDAEQSYLRSVVEYNKAIVDLNFRKGMSLRNHSVYLAEGQWNPPAYDDARRRAEATTNAIDNPFLKSEPLEFVGGPAPNAWESLGDVDRPHVSALTNPDSASFGEFEPPSDWAVPSVPDSVPPKDAQQDGDSEPKSPGDDSEKPAPDDSEEPKPLLIPDDKSPAVTGRTKRRSAVRTADGVQQEDPGPQGQRRSSGIRHASGTQTRSDQPESATSGTQQPGKAASVKNKSDNSRRLPIQSLFGGEMIDDFRTIQPSKSSTPGSSDDAENFEEFRRITPSGKKSVPK